MKFAMIRPAPALDAKMSFVAMYHVFKHTRRRLRRGRAAAVHCAEAIIKDSR